MELVLSVIYLIGGFMLLIYGADKFVDGAVALSKKLGIPSLIVGLTIVAAGTSMPEMAVSVSSAMAGSADMATSNVIGSNMFNVLGVLGVCSIINPLSIQKIVLKWDYPFCLGVTLAVGVCIYLTGMLNGLTAWAFLLVYVAYVVITIMIMKKQQKSEAAVGGAEAAVEVAAEEDVPFVWYKCAFNILGGLCAIVTGGEIVVQNASSIGASFGMSEALIGLTICAVGTSLPELVTSVVAARKGDTGVAIGNVIGSNLFNLLGILTITGIIKNPGFTVDTSMVLDANTTIDMIFCLAVFVFGYICCLTGKKINRAEGIAMVSAYVIYVVYAVLRT